MFQILLSPFAVILSLSTGTGVLIHETKVDKVTALSMIPTSTIQQSASHSKANLLSSTPHTHVESAFLESASSQLRSKNPNQNPRRNEDKKYLLQKRVVRGFHLFDSYYLPLDEII